jgi:hypothetical protein
VKNVPIPFHWKMVSVMIAPLSKKPKSKATAVVSGIRALRIAWRRMTRRSDKPLARAVRT